jgi:capsular exopolysaccharide synthesis family protein
VVPSAKRDIRTQIVSSQRSGVLGGLFARQIASNPADRSKDLVANWRNTGSVVAESYRSAVASIILWGRDTVAPHKMLVVTSAHSSAGKTTSVLNLGLGLVESGRRVLLIDGDLRLPRLGQIFGLEQASGLTNILAEQLHPDIATELIRQTGLPGLDVLPSGPRYVNVTELLHSDRLSDLFEMLKEEYDFILIDTPPALPLTDARLLAQYADGVIIVVRAGMTTIDQTLNIQQSFAQDGSHIFGTILNHWDANSEDPAYMGSYLKYASAPAIGAAPARIAQGNARLNTKKRTAAAND